MRLIIFTLLLIVICPLIWFISLLGAAVFSRGDEIQDDVILIVTTLSFILSVLAAFKLSGRKKKRGDSPQAKSSPETKVEPPKKKKSPNAAFNWSFAIILPTTTTIGFVVLISLGSHELHNIYNWIGGVVLALPILAYLAWTSETCPECGKYSSFDKIRSESVGEVTKHESRTHVTKHFDSSRNLVGTSEKEVIVPVKHITYKVTHRCNNCGFTKTTQETKPG